MWGICRKSCHWRREASFHSGTWKVFCTFFQAYLGSNWFFLFHQIFLVRLAFEWNKLLFPTAEALENSNVLFNYTSKSAKMDLLPWWWGELAVSQVRSKVQLQEDLCGDTLVLWEQHKPGGRAGEGCCLCTGSLAHCLPPSGASLHIQRGSAAGEEGCEGWMACCFSDYELIFSFLEFKLSYKWPQLCKVAVQCMQVWPLLHVTLWRRVTASSSCRERLGISEVRWYKCPPEIFKPG